MISVEKGLAKNTVEAYSRDLAGLAEFMLEQKVTRWDVVEPIHLRLFVSSLRARNLSSRSIARQIVTVRRFYRFLQTEGLVTSPPVPEFHLSGTARKLPHALNGEDVRSLLNKPDPNQVLGARDQAMLELLSAPTPIRAGLLHRVVQASLDHALPEIDWDRVYSRASGYRLR